MIGFISISSKVSKRYKFYAMQIVDTLNPKQQPQLNLQADELKEVNPT
jgi:hypothetical protein